MRNHWKAALCIVILTTYSSLGMCAPPGASVVWRLATGYRAESFHTENLLQFSLEVEDATRKQLRIEVLPNGELFKLSEIRQAVEDGRVQAGEVIMTSLAQAVPLAGADSVPFVVGSYPDAQRFWQLERPGLERQLAQRGLRVLYAVPWPPQGLYATRPIKSLGDLKGLRMRTYNQTTVRIAEFLGASPVDIPMADVGQAIQEGRIDTMITSAVTGVENQVWGSIKYYYDIRAWFPKNLVFVNAKQFDALTTEQRTQVLAAAAAAEQRGWARSEVEARKAVQILQTHGVKIERLSYDLESKLQRMGERFSREWVNSVGHDADAIFVPYYFR